jgi:formylglycine-generating enzyme required for sulfatase activity
MKSATYVCVAAIVLGAASPAWTVPDRQAWRPAGHPGSFVNSLGMRFVWIKPGTFMMGSPAEEDEHRSYETQHQVTLTKGFFMGAHLVTQEQWQAIMGNNPSQFKGEKDLPVETVSWLDCQEFVKKLSVKDKRAYRLPTEAEWEFACRAGTTTPLYFGATITTDQANYHGDFVYGPGQKGVNRGRTTPVHAFAPNSWGLCDMSGNVRQWCQDRYAPFTLDAAVDPQGPGEGKSRVNRGGAYYLNPSYSRSASRGNYAPEHRFSYIGVRLCVSAAAN